ncbi:MAG: hypothetical protein IJ589_05725 [Lachnospiraceae bacterium]|nr:hypothetical protein [Lachnospiraceae bacterium]
MEELDFYGKMIYREGWFLYFRRNGQVCVLTREDARMIEYSYEKYREYELSQDSMSRMYEGTYPFEEYGFTRAPIYSKTDRQKGNGGSCGKCFRKLPGNACLQGFSLSNRQISE